MSGKSWKEDVLIYIAIVMAIIIAVFSFSPSHRTAVAADKPFVTLLRKQEVNPGWGYHNQYFFLYRVNGTGQCLIAFTEDSGHSGGIAEVQCPKEVTE